MTPSPAIIIADDDQDDRLLLQEAFNHIKIPNPVYFTENGIELLQMLEQNDYHHAQKTGLILLDLNMPMKNGFEALKEIKSNEQLMHIPTVIYTTSSLEEDIISSYRHGANAYIIKPQSFQAILDIVVTVYKFWFSYSKMPYQQMIKTF